MGYTFTARGTITVTPSVPLACLWELLERRVKFTVAPVGAGESELAALAVQFEWLLVPATDAITDTDGRPSHIASLMVATDARSYVINDALGDFSDWVGDDHQLDGQLRYQGDAGEKGAIWPWDDDSGHFPEWEETHGPTYP